MQIYILYAQTPSESLALAAYARRADAEAHKARCERPIGDDSCSRCGSPNNQSAAEIFAVSLQIKEITVKE